MKYEIKEILDRLKIKSDRYNHHLKYNMSYENKNEDYEASLLLDYITNLRTIEQQYSAILSENAELENKITNLQEENERQEELISRLYSVISDDEENFKLLEQENEKLILNILEGDKDD